MDVRQWTIEMMTSNTMVICGRKILKDDYRNHNFMILGFQLKHIHFKNINYFQKKLVATKNAFIFVDIQYLPICKDKKMCIQKIHKIRSQLNSCRMGVYLDKLESSPAAPWFHQASHLVGLHSWRLVKALITTYIRKVKYSLRLLVLYSYNWRGERLLK